LKHFVLPGHIRPICETGFGNVWIFAMCVFATIYLFLKICFFERFFVVVFSLFLMLETLCFTWPHLLYSQDRFLKWVGFWNEFFWWRSIFFENLFFFWKLFFGCLLFVFSLFLMFETLLIYLAKSALFARQFSLWNVLFWRQSIFFWRSAFFNFFLVVCFWRLELFFLPGHVRRVRRQGLLVLKITWF